MKQHRLQVSCHCYSTDESGNDTDQREKDCLAEYE